MLSRIQAEPGISRADLARDFGFSEMASTRIARDLLGANIIEEFDLTRFGKSKPKRIGRPKIGLRINPTGAFAAGITVSAYYSEVSICDANGDTVARREVGNNSFADASKTAQIYSDALLSLIEASNVEPERIVGVGVALSAKTSPEQNESVRSEYFGWDDDGGQFWSEIRKNTRLPVVIENIANALAISEMRFGVARNASEFALVHVATFAGVGAVSDSQIVRGVSGGAGRIGHFRAVDTSLTCTCGRNDCINLSATGFSVLAKLDQLDHTAFDQSKLPVYAQSLVAAVNEPANENHIRQAGRHLAWALDPMAKLLAPEVIILSGILGAHDAYFSGIESELAKEFDYGPGSSFQLEKGTISPRKAASLLALHAFCYSDRLDFERLNNTADTTGGGAAYA